MKPVHDCSAEELIAEANRRDENRRLGRPLDYVAPDVRTVEQLADDDERAEKEIVRAMDKRMRAAGFVVVEYSQPRASKQTPGIPDREYFHPGLGLFAKWEAKTPRGVQSPAQYQYQSWCDACGVPYLVGPPHVLEAWCRMRGVVLPPAT